MRRFENFAVIDWSGAKGARHRGIAIALCSEGKAAPKLVRPDHRWSRQEVLDWLLDELPANTLVGFDLSPGLPFLDRNGFFPGWANSPCTAKALWKMVDELADDDPHLAATSVVAHSELRRHFRHRKGDCGDLFEPGAGRMRLTESRQRQHRLNPSSCFNLIGAAQVGKSSLTGMRLLHRLNGKIPVWPFDPVPTEGSLIVEIYTSLAARAAGIPAGKSKMLSGEALDSALAEIGVDRHSSLDRYTDHATDAILTAAWLRLMSYDPALWAPKDLEKVSRTEGWTFGVV